MELSPWDPEDVQVMLHPDGSLAEESLPAGFEAKKIYKRLVAARCLDLKTEQQSLPMWASAAGEEAVQVAVSSLIEDQEWLYPGARDLSAYLGRGIPVAELVDQIGRLRGDKFMPLQAGTVGSPDYWIAPTPHALGMNLPLAAGHAQAHKQSGRPLITVCLFGEGLTTTGPFHETIALASANDLPIVFVCKSQMWPDGAPAEAGLMGDNVADRVRSCGLWTRRVDGADVVATFDAISRAFDRSRSGQGPCLVEVVVTPINRDAPAHRDPVERMRSYLDKQGEWTQTFQDVVEAEFKGAFDTALKDKGAT